MFSSRLWGSALDRPMEIWHERGMQSSPIETAASSAPAGPEAALVFWLPPEEAALRFGVAASELVAATRRGELKVRAKVAGGELVATLCSTELIAKYGAPVLGKLEQPLTSADRERVEKLSKELEDSESRTMEAKLESARLSGQLEVADRVERSLLRYAERVDKRLEDVSVTYEAKLQDAERMRLQMARTLGRMEAELLKLQAGASGAEVPARPLALGAGAKRAASKAPKARRRWFFGR